MRNTGNVRCCFPKTNYLRTEGHASAHFSLQESLMMVPEAATAQVYFWQGSDGSVAVSFTWENSFHQQNNVT